jgi:hypothetical protein
LIRQPNGKAPEKHKIFYVFPNGQLDARLPKQNQMVLTTVFPTVKNHESSAFVAVQNGGVFVTRFRYGVNNAPCP